MGGSQIQQVNEKSAPPTYSQWVRRKIVRKWMIRMEINGGPGRITAYFPVGCQRLVSLLKNCSRQLLLRCSNYGRPALTYDFFEPSTCRL